MSASVLADELSALLGLPTLTGTAQLAALYRAISLRAPSVKGGRIAQPAASAMPAAVSVQYELPDVENNTKLRLEQQYALLPPGDASHAGATIAYPVGAPVPVDSKVSQWLSPSGQHAVRLTAVGDDRVLQLCTPNDPVTVEATIAVGKGTHTAILEAPHYQNIDWTDDERCVVYCAEAAAALGPKLWDASKPPPSGAASAAAETSAFEAVQSFGEAFTAFTSIGLFVVDRAAKKVRALLPAEFLRSYAAVSPCWLQDDASGDGRQAVAFVAVPTHPTKLGLAHCCNRPAKLFVAFLPADATTEPIAPVEVPLPPGAPTLRNLRRHGSRLAALQPAASAAHASGVALVTCAATLSGLGSWTEEVPIVAVPAPLDDSAFPGFPGIFPVTGSDVFWVSENEVLLSSIVGSSVQLLLVTTTAASEASPALASATRRIRRVTYDASSLALLGGAAAVASSTMNVLHSDGRQVLLSWSTATAPPVVFYVADILAPCVRLVPVGRQTPPFLSTAATEVVQLTSAGRSVESLLHRQRRDGWPLLPLVLFVHGGPHGTDTGMFSLVICFYLANGFNVLSVNYGGSLGFGQAQVDGLLGHAGGDDVADVMAALRDAQARFGLAGPVVISGGSHGGFLTAHLSSRYPSVFAAAILRNPVIDIGAMYYATDIPDWCLAEAGAVSAATAGDVERMALASPTRFLTPTMTVPTIVGLGLNDLRVPISQGRAWVRLVRAANPQTPIRLLEYPGTGHAMDSPQAALDFAVHSMAFVQNHLSGASADASASTTPLA